jgi:microcystin degradation protein MlrC
MGFPAADFDECAPMVWGYGPTALAATQAVAALYTSASEPTQWRPDVLDAPAAVARAMALAATADQPVVMADTQDNPGAGGDSNTTGLLHELLRQGAGKRYPGQVAVGLLFDPETAKKAVNAANVQVDKQKLAIISVALGKSVPTWSDQFSDPPVQGPFTVRAISDGVCTLKGRMMNGLTVHLGASACLEIDGILVAVVSGKKQMLDRELFRMVGIEPEQMKILVVKSSNHFRADFAPIASAILIAKAAGPMAADPADLPWKKLSPQTRPKP